jgi:hypothetical protein
MAEPGVVAAYPMIQAATMMTFQACHLRWAGSLALAPGRRFTQAVAPTLTIATATTTAIAQPLMCSV